MPRLLVRIVRVLLVAFLVLEMTPAAKPFQGNSLRCHFDEQALSLRPICRPSLPALAIFSLAIGLFNPIGWSQTQHQTPYDRALHAQDIQKRMVYKRQLMRLLQAYRDASNETSRKSLERDFRGIIEEVEGFNALPELCATTDQNHDWLGITYQLLDSMTKNDSASSLGNEAIQDIADARIALSGVELELENKRELAFALSSKMPMPTIPDLAPSNKEHQLGSIPWRYVFGGITFVGFSALLGWGLIRYRRQLFGRWLSLPFPPADSEPKPDLWDEHAIQSVAERMVTNLKMQGAYAGLTRLDSSGEIERWGIEGERALHAFYRLGPIFFLTQDTFKKLAPSLQQVLKEHGVIVPSLETSTVESLRRAA